MAFPLNPSANELYTNALGNTWKYNATDKVWNLTGSQAAVGPGTVNTLAMFTPDTSSVGDSVLSQDTGNLVSTGNFTVNKTNTEARVDIYTADTAQISLLKTASGNSEAYLISYGTTWPTTSGGPDGGDSSGGSELTSGSPAYFEINQQYPAKKMHLSYRHQTRLTVADEGVGLQNQNPVGIFHPKKGLSDCQKSINYNVGPTGSYVDQILDSGMVHLIDTVSITQATQLNFTFPTNTLVGGLIGHGTIHYWERRYGDSYSCHFTIRTSAEASMTVTIDYGDTTEFPLIDAGDGIRILTTNVATTAPTLILKAVGMTSVYEMSYDIHLRRVVFNTGT